MKIMRKLKDIFSKCKPIDNEANENTKKVVQKIYSTIRENRKNISRTKSFSGSTGTTPSTQLRFHYK